MHVQKLADIAKQRAVAFDQFNALALKDDLSADEVKTYDELQASIKNYDAQAVRVKSAQAASAAVAQPVAGQQNSLPAQAKSDDDYTKKDGLTIGGVVRMLAVTKGNLREAASHAGKIYGEQHPVAKAFVEGTGPGGGYLVARHPMEKFEHTFPPP